MFLDIAFEKKKKSKPNLSQTTKLTKEKVVGVKSHFWTRSA